MLLHESQLLGKVFLVVWMEHDRMRTVGLSNEDRAGNTFVGLDCLRIGRICVTFSVDRMHWYLNLVEWNLWLLNIFQIAYHSIQIMGIARIKSHRIRHVSQKFFEEGIFYDFFGPLVDFLLGGAIGFDCIGRS